MIGLVRQEVGIRGSSIVEVVSYPFVFLFAVFFVRNLLGTFIISGGLLSLSL
jgi:hypothetical protein